MQNQLWPFKWKITIDASSISIFVGALHSGPFLQFRSLFTHFSISVDSPIESKWIGIIECTTNLQNFFSLLLLLRNVFPNKIMWVWIFAIIRIKNNSAPRAWWDYKCILSNNFRVFLFYISFARWFCCRYLAHANGSMYFFFFFGESSLT